MLLRGGCELIACPLEFSGWSTAGCPNEKGHAHERDAYSRSVAERTEIEKRDGEMIGGAGYAELLNEVRRQVRAARIRAARAVNTELIAAYWRIGHMILERQEAEGWGARVIEQLAADLRGDDIKGFSVRNLKYMRTFVHLGICLDILTTKTPRIFRGSAAFTVWNV